MPESKNERNIVRGIIILVLADIPQWLASVWSLFCNKPLYQWLQEKGIATPPFSLLWITWPAGLILLGILVRNSFKENNKSNEERTKEAVDKIAKRNFPERFESVSDLEMESVPLDIATAQYHLCQIRIHNKNPTKTADNVRVELIALEDAAGTSPADNYFRPAFPVILKPEIAGESTINPGASQKYNLFRVTMNVKSAIIKDGVAIGWQQKFLAYFTQETTKDVTQFVWKESYRLKLAVTARDFMKAERELFLTFSDEGGFCRFNLTNTQLSKAAEKRQPEPFVVVPEYVGEFSEKSG